LLQYNGEPQTLDIDFENGAIVYIYNSPDSLWRFRRCDLDTRPVVDGGGLMLQTKSVTKPSWMERTFATPEDAIQFFSRELKSEPARPVD
jgi:hypothetical protein